MNKHRSIKQKAYPDALPNFRNLGVTLRILLLGNGMALLKSLVDADNVRDVPARLMQISALFTPILLASLLLLWLTEPILMRLKYWYGVTAINVLVVGVTLMIYRLGGALYQPFAAHESYFGMAQYGLLSLMVCGILLMYFRLRSQVLSRALDDARLQVLRARIRPHFLFNTINAVLSIVRAQPKQAETALEDMSDLFRMAMGEAQDLVVLSQEIQLSKQYLALEKLRMGERLSVDWHMHDVPGDALIPPLLLQPLLENAVYHGIESLAQGGLIAIRLSRQAKELQLVVENPCAATVAEGHSGNKMALQNIRERLALLFDVEARYQVERGDEFYRVIITLPCVTKEDLWIR
jgi:two-component system sensor histidine kinase AlgZ